MNTLLWDGEMDCGWEDLATKVKLCSERYAQKMLETVAFSPEAEAIELISSESMSRFCLLAEQLANQIEEGYYYQYEDIDHIQNATKLVSWIILGSLTESALQAFLAFYISDYKEAQWQQWTSFPAEEVRQKINETIEQMIADSIIDKKQGKSLKDATKDCIKKHTIEHPVQRVMLDEIIQFYVSQNLLDDEEVMYLKTIQSNQNGIHSFESRKIGNWDNLQYSVRFWCYLLEWILFHLPDIPDLE